MALGTSRATVTRALTTNTLRIVIALPVSLVLLPIVFSRLTAGQFGVWAVLSTLLAVGALADGGVRTEMVRRVADAIGRGDRQAAAASASQGLSILLVTGLTVTVVGWLIAPAVASFAFSGGPTGVPRSDTIELLRGVLLLLGAALVTNGLFAVLTGLQRPDFENLGALAGTLAGAATTIAFVYQGVGVWALLWGSVAQWLAACLVQLRGLTTLPADLRPRLVLLGGGTLRAYVGLSSLLLLSQISNVVDFEFDKLILARYVDSAASGHYDIGTTVVLQVRVFALVPLTVALAGLAELFSRSPADAQRLFANVRSAVLALTAVLMSLLFVFGPAMVRIWLGDSFGDAGTASRMLAVAMAANAVAAPGAYYAVSRGWHHLAAIGALVNIIVNAGTSYTLVVLHGFSGALWGSIAGNVAATVVFLALLYRQDRSVAVAGLIRPVLAAALLSAASIALGAGDASLSAATLAVLVPGWLVVAVGLLLVLRVVDVSSLRAVGRVAARARTSQAMPVGDPL